MSKRRMLLAALLAVGLGGLLWLVLSSAPREPVYNGKPLRYWLTGYGSTGFTAASPNGSSGPNDLQADEAVQHFGTNAIPTLMWMLHERESPLKSRLILLAQKQHLIPVARWSAVMETIKAIRAFRALGVQPVGMAPQMLELYDSNPNRFTRQVVPSVLIGVSPDSPGTVPLLLRALGETNDALVRANAVIAIKQLRPKPDLVVPVLTKSLNDPDNWVRANAAYALAVFKSDAGSAIPTLMQIISSEPKGTDGAATTGPIAASPAVWHVGPGTGCCFMWAPPPAGQRSVFVASDKEVFSAMEYALREINPTAAQAALK